MGVRFPSVQSNTLINSVLVNAAETVIITSPPFSPAYDGAIVFILVSVAVNAVGATATLAQLKLRRGTLVTGPQVNINASMTATPASQFYASMVYFDGPGVVAGQQYTLTLTMAGATANSTVNDASIMVFAL